MTKYIQCVQNDNKNVTPQETIYAIKNAGFDGVFLQWYNKDWDFSQQEQLNLCRKLGLEIPFVHLGYKGINNIWLEAEDGENLVKNYLKMNRSSKFSDARKPAKQGFSLMMFYPSTGITNGSTTSLVTRK